VNIPHGDQRIDQNVLHVRRNPVLRHSLSDMKREAALGRVGIDGQYLPMNLVSPGWQWLQPDTHDAGVDRWFAQIDACAIGIVHFDGAECRLQILGVRKNELTGRGWHSASDAWLRMIEKGVSFGCGAGHDSEEGCCRKSW
jgi:hypothetical protein